MKRLVYGLVPAIGSWELPAGGVTQPPWSHQAQSSTDFSAVQEIMSSIKKTKKKKIIIMKKVTGHSHAQVAVLGFSARG